MRQRISPSPVTGGSGADAATGVDPRLSTIRSETDALIANVLDREQPHLRDLGLADHLDTLRPLLLSGGKRMRAVFCHWGWRGAGGRGPGEDVVAAGAALEINHSAFLIHDDILDRSDTRRGQPALHRSLATHHARHAWHGEAASFGDATALTLGDLCFAWADELISQCTTADRQRAVVELYHRMYVDAVYGQVLELQIQADRDYQPERCLRVATYKAARYMLTPPLRIGAVLAGAGEDLHRAYAAFGTALGEAYQLRDDLLGVFGDPAVTGKPNLDDLREGKPTVLFATALQRATASQRQELLAAYGRQDIDPATADRLRVLLRDTGAPDVVEDMIHARSRQATEALAAAPLTSEARDVLEHLAARALFRTR